jgi:hypothetical protein
MVNTEGMFGFRPPVATPKVGRVAASHICGDKFGRHTFMADFLLRFCVAAALVSGTKHTSLIFMVSHRCGVAASSHQPNALKVQFQ